MGFAPAIDVRGADTAALARLKRAMAEDRSRLCLTGERGPEMFVPASGAKVITPVMPRLTVGQRAEFKSLFIDPIVKAEA
jgi:hypothetical protein